MAWKGVHISRPARLSSKDAQLVVAQDEGDVTIPLEDVAWVVLDSNLVTLTATLVSSCMEKGIAIIFTNDRHTPNGVALPFHTHHRQAAIASMQIGLTQPLKKRLWQAIAVAKIENQAKCLERNGKPASSVSAMSQLVSSGDPHNVEARAAREYWGLLFPSFIRSDESDLRNKMLNYGYAILRASLGRALVANGLLPCFGLFHESATNAFNLADDLIEPFRPLIDNRVFELSENGTTAEGDLTIEQRRALASILNTDIRLNRETVSVLIATERASGALVRAMESSTPALLELPRFL